MRAASKPSLLSVEQVAERLGVTPRYVGRLAAERRIRFFKVCHLLRFAEEDLDQWIQRICTEPIGARSFNTPASFGGQTASTSTHRDRASTALITDGDVTRPAALNV